jgi:hypothetical protein
MIQRAALRLSLFFQAAIRLKVNYDGLNGEGSKAFLRLQEEIARSGSDLSLLAWSLAPTWRLLPGNNFCGIFAPSAAEFRDGHNLRLTGWALEQNFDFSLADRGLLRINRNIICTEMTAPDSYSTVSPQTTRPRQVRHGWRWT